jgi:hypothetical protein
LNESFWLNAKTHSNVDLYETLSNPNITLGDFLKVSELVVEGSGFRNRLKTLFSSLKPEIREKVGFLQFLFQPNNLDLEFDGDLNDLVDEESSRFMSTSIGQVGTVMDFLKKSLHPELLSAANNFEIGVNFFDAFIKLKLYSKSVFTDVDASQNLN